MSQVISNGSIASYRSEARPRFALCGVSGVGTVTFKFGGPQGCNEGSAPTSKMYHCHIIITSFPMRHCKIGSRQAQWSTSHQSSRSQTTVPLLSDLILQSTLSCPCCQTSYCSQHYRSLVVRPYTAVNTTAALLSCLTLQSTLPCPCCQTS